MKNKGVQQFYAFGRLKAKTMKLKQKNTTEVGITNWGWIASNQAPLRAEFYILRPHADAVHYKREDKIKLKVNCYQNIL